MSEPIDKAVEEHMAWKLRQLHGLKGEGDYDPLSSIEEQNKAKVCPLCHRPYMGREVHEECAICHDAIANAASLHPEPVKRPDNILVFVPAGIHEPITSDALKDRVDSIQLRFNAQVEEQCEAWMLEELRKHLPPETFTLPPDELVAVLKAEQIVAKEIVFRGQDAAVRNYALFRCGEMIASMKFEATFKRDGRAIAE